MTVFAGLWRFAKHDAHRDLLGATSAMIAAQQLGELARARVRVSCLVALGQSPPAAPFQRILDAHANDHTMSGSLLAIDARVDNRAELFDKLARPPDDLIDDESLIFLAYRRWGESLVDHVLGDFAIAAWSSSRQTITLIRDPTGQRPLHYHWGHDFVAFASLPRGLLALDEINAEPNRAQLSRFIANVPQAGTETFYCGITQVEPAQTVRITRSGVDAQTYWDMPTGELRYRDDGDYIAAFREQLDRATQVRLRGSEQVVAAQLSAGLDSSAVAATAARLLAAGGGRVLALTSAPRVGFAGPAPHGRIADESGIAASLVATYPNMKHVIVRPTDVSPLDLLGDDSRLLGQPVGLPCNNVWWQAANADARARGACTVLVGETGNLTMSAGGLGVLADYLRKGQLFSWLREVRALAKGEPRWRGLLAASFAPWLPPNLWAVLTKLSGDGSSAPSTTLLTAAAARLAAGSTPIGMPCAGQSERELRWQLLRQLDPGNFRKSALLKWGIDERDPTADRRLVEFCFSLPPSQLVGSGQTRRLARAGLADRLPAAILNGARGYQFADWYESLDRDSLAAFSAQVATNPAAASVIDFTAVDRLIADWPPGAWASAQTIGTYRIGLLRALSAGAFALNADQ